MDILQGLLIALIVLLVFYSLSDKESFVPKIIGRAWRRDKDPLQERQWYWFHAEHPGLKCIDNCWYSPYKDMCINKCEQTYGLPMDPNYRAMRARGLLAYY